MDQAALDGMPVDPRTTRAAGASTIAFLLAVSGWTLLAAFLLSTQFLAQPFVWINFPPDAIAVAWLTIFRNRLIVTACIAAGVALASGVPHLTTVPRGVLVVVAIVAAAFAGESLLSFLGLEHQGIGTRTMLLRVSRWCVIALGIAAIFLLYRRALRGRAAIHDGSLRVARLERQAVESRLLLLRSQIEPHFLFNTLATIRHLHRSTPEEGATMLVNFIDYLRAAIPRAADDTSCLGDEIDLVRAYFGLIDVRMSGRLTWSIEADETLAAQPFPRLALATLAENAIKHGIVPAADGGHVTIVVRRASPFVEASVIDTGVGLSMAGGGSGIGLANTRARLASLYGPTARLTLMHNQPRGVCASIRIPLRVPASGERDR